MEQRSSWRTNHRLWLEVFLFVNLGFLGPDISMAHSTNSFREETEYIPLYFSLVAPILLLVGLVAWRWGNSLWRWLGFAVGWTAVLLGIVGLILHLESRFFREQTLDSLVYTAPFAAPLAYTGIGLLLIMNRMVDASTVEWPLWVLLLALGGFVGNFIFSLADHAQNGFFHWTEWLPVASSAFAIGFLAVPCAMPIRRGFLWGCACVLLLQAPIGLLGFYLHNSANIRGPSGIWFDNFVYGAPPFAPLLLPNLALLAGIGLWVLRGHVPEGRLAELPDASP